MASKKDKDKDVAPGGWMSRMFGLTPVAPSPDTAEGKKQLDSLNDLLGDEVDRQGNPIQRPKNPKKPKGPKKK
jgi:hypothetical protein